MPGIRTNLPRESLRWSLTRAAEELGVASYVTLATRLEEAGQKPGPDGCFSTKQLVAVAFGDLHAQRLRKLGAEATKTELEIGILKADYLSRFELEGVFSQIAEGILHVIKGSKLSWEEQADFRKQISLIPVRIRDVARVQRRQSRDGTDGDGSQPARRSKRKPADESELKKSGVPKNVLAETFFLGRT